MFPFSRTYIRRTIRFNSIRRGLLGGSKFWLGVLAAGYVRRSAQKVTKRGEVPVVFSEKLKPGESYEIRHIDPKNT